MNGIHVIVFLYQLLSNTALANSNSSDGWKVENTSTVYVSLHSKQQACGLTSRFSCITAVNVLLSGA
jgi:hypothetical protein